MLQQHPTVARVSPMPTQTKISFFVTPVDVHSSPCSRRDHDKILAHFNTPHLGKLQAQPKGVLEGYEDTLAPSDPRLKIMQVGWTGPEYTLVQTLPTLLTQLSLPSSGKCSF